MLPVQPFKNFLALEALLQSGDRILLAVSGGKDSVLMVYLFQAVGIDFGIAHCNFQLRADESQRDENFVRTLAHSFGIPFYVTHFDTKKYAAENKISTQMAARELRYQWFEEIRASKGYEYIALAQHQNDALETVLINLTRGTGISGLHGILPKRDKLIRPLLFLTRKEINEVVEQNNLAFVEDSSNLSSDYVRNKIRLEVVPHLQEINPNLERTFAENSARFSEIEHFLESAVNKIANKIVSVRKDGIYIPLAEIDKLNPQKLLLFELLKPYGFVSSVVNEILQSGQKQSGKHFYSEKYEAIINRTDLILVARDTKELMNQYIHSDTEVISFGDYRFEMEQSASLNFERTPNKAFLNAHELIFPLVLRHWQNGDKFIPLGMKGFKKLSDFFIDEKLPLHLKTTIPILVNGNGEVVWVAGMRQDDRYKVTPGIKKVYILEIRNQEFGK
ncbi:tRNA lysidine(34) synthetase TilS [Pedobacter sp. MW01-1-1]|uniref:tRNA lysidine(34) synthetase TilS n=1 Tax=Pedobacter sp. MW01-1-1 TaxID=3383027 RepID=UPI003FEFDA62